MMVSSYQCRQLHFTALGDGNVLHGLPLWVCEGPRILNLGYYIHALYHIAEYYVLSIQMRSTVLSGDDEELTAIGIGPAVLCIVRATWFQMMHTDNLLPLTADRACRAVG